MGVENIRSGGGTTDAGWTYPPADEQNSLNVGAKVVRKS